MSAQSQASRVRVAPDSDAELPESKKARLASGTVPTIVQDNVSPQARAKSELRSKTSKRKSKHKKPDLPEVCSPEDVLWHEIKSVLGPSAIEKAVEGGTEYDSPFAFHQEVEVVVKSLSPSGELNCFNRW
jgi:tRNA (uracil-5-)-methyltransferase